MFDLINGIPMHPLVVHGVVVLLPLAIVGTVAIAVRPLWRATYGPLVVASALIATVLMPIATSSGEALEKHVGNPGEHAELGDQLLWFSLPLLVLVTALVLMDRVQTRRNTGTPTDAGAPTSSPGARRARTSRTTGRATTVVAVLAVVASVAAGVQVYRVGDSGARAAWGDKVGTNQSPAKN